MSGRREARAGEEIGAGDLQTQEVMARCSHELRNYLATIRLASRVLGASASGSDAANARELIERQVKQMTRLVEDLLDVSRIRTGHLHLQRERVDLCTVARRALEAVKFTLQLRKHRLSTSLPDTPIWLLGDADRLEQVFVNLLMNAAKYTEPGGHVVVSVNQEADEAVVRVRDTGVGIAADVLQHVFEPYVQAKPSSRGGGLGLGLPLARSLIESHGGRVTAASAGAGRGSEFTIRLPLLAEPQPEPGRRARHDPHQTHL